MNDYEMPIGFPGLFGDWQFKVSGVLLDVGNGIRWYGLLIAVGMLCALALCIRLAPRYKLKSDDLYDVILWLLPIGVIGARLYYVLFYLDLFRAKDGSLDFGAMLRIWDGGLAIYGGVIAGAAVVFFFTRKRKIPFLALFDCIIPGLMLGQAIGRWGNFMNREAYGAETSVPWRMRLFQSAQRYIDVHPTFLYESLWNVIGLLVLLFVIAKIRKFNGENACFYFVWYGIGRFFIEGLRTDSLYFFGVRLFGQPLRVSQALSALLVLGGAVAWIIGRRKSSQIVDNSAA